MCRGWKTSFPYAAAAYARREANLPRRKKPLLFPAVLPRKLSVITQECLDPIFKEPVPV